MNRPKALLTTHSDGMSIFTARDRTGLSSRLQRRRGGRHRATAVRRRSERAGMAERRNGTLRGSEEHRVRQCRCARTLRAGPGHPRWAQLQVHVFLRRRHVSRGERGNRGQGCCYPPRVLTRARIACREPTDSRLVTSRPLGDALPGRAKRVLVRFHPVALPQMSMMWKWL